MKGMQSDNLVAEVEKAVLPLLERHGYELVLAQFAPRSGVLRLYIDHANGVSIDDCSTVSRLVGDLLDAEGFSDRIKGRYVLEVSSPGLDRPLAKPAHFKRFVGQRVNVTTRQPLGGRRRFQGELATADDAGISISWEGQTQAIEYEQIEGARLVPDL